MYNCSCTYFVFLQSYLGNLKVVVTTELITAIEFEFPTAGKCPFYFPGAGSCYTAQ